jgi:hypothetical protein
MIQLVHPEIHSGTAEPFPARIRNETTNGREGDSTLEDLHHQTFCIFNYDGSEKYERMNELALIASCGS